MLFHILLPQLQMRKALISILIILAFACCKGQHDSVSAVSMDSIWLVKSFIKDEGRLWASPFKKPKKDVLFWIPVLVATGISIHYDEEIYEGFKDYQEKNDWVDQVSPVITLGGDGSVDMAICAGFYVGGLLFKNDKAMQTGLLSAQALAHAGLVVTVGKQFTSRKRPHGADEADHGKDKWHWFPTGFREFTHGDARSEYDAFPSGHTISAWAVGTVIAKQYKDKKWVGAICYLAATGVGLSRITEDTHWLSDVILGAAMGYGIGRNMVRHHADTKWMLFPTTWEKNLMLTGVYRL